MNLHRVRRRLNRVRNEAVDRLGLTEAEVRRGLRGITGGSAYHVLIAPPGAGNIGDQAMVEAFLAAADRPVTVVTRRPGDFAFAAPLGERARILALPSLFYGRGRAHRADLARLADALRDAASVSIVGADIMDGVYVLHASLRRSAIARATASAGIDTTVIGFSWSSAAPSRALAALRSAGAAGARLLLRDPASAARVRAAGVSGVVDTADIVFTDDRRDDEAAAAILADVEPGRPVALVNASGLIARKLDQAPEYAAIVDHLRGRGMAVVLLPHVLRDTADDLAACRAVHDAVGDEHVVLVDSALSPSAIRGLAARADLAITGRMHLAVMSLGQGVPAITLATQGKVEGLMRLFDWPELCVAPTPGMGREVIRVADAALDDASASDRVRRGVQRARHLASANISTIATADSGPSVASNGQGSRNVTKLDNSA